MLRVNPADWETEMEDSKQFLAKFGSRLQQEIRDEHGKLPLPASRLRVNQQLISGQICSPPRFSRRIANAAARHPIAVKSIQDDVGYMN